ncbi:Superfamily II DNA and RNA helicase [Alkalicoccus daliensis]|uniref:ATP-dependent RNA helicase DbpA n=2 Tax=Alkalicoccus daliensis TaxID=745820 RepID=A0A1H0JN55_9BACI|nr:Superfamily II DNA and RNA helicase [Alkalicoccus daliensis]
MKNGFTQFGLSEEIVEALDGLKYKEPTEVQERVIPEAMQRKDVVVKAQTGSGKTAAFAAPICEQIVWEENKPQALILTPTRELAMQVREEIQNIGRFKRIKASLLVGQQPAAPQRVELKQKVHVVVGTPGRVLDHLKKGTLALDKVKHLVLDEADEMLNMGFIDQVEEIIGEVPEARTTSLFSATLPRKVRDLADFYMRSPETIEVKTAAQKPDISFRWIQADEEEKFKVLTQLLAVERPESAILFCARKETVDDVERRLTDEGISAAKIHGGLEQKDRTRVMQEFKRGTVRYLVATDVAARGIDVSEMPLVVNYDVPEEADKFVHRTGRTARAGKSGEAITIAAPREKRFVAEIERYTNETVNWEEAPLVTTADQRAFDQLMETVPQMKKNKSAPLEKNITKLYFNGGKKKKLRAVDFVGTITNIPEVTADDIGVISIEQLATYVDILNGKGSVVLQEMQERTVKGKRLKVREARN